ncbi:hypothetical protein F5Y05DRAFT_419372 [Hypoxylon sp. FL0543]|nr:hypothetical protein F5Y05DRAFT_419372 [Hypoxylon sp. FL0543]
MERFTALIAHRGGFALEMEHWWDFHNLPRIPIKTKMSTNYQGANHPANESQDIEASASCSIWVTGLPPNCTIKQLLSSIRSAGKIFSCNVNLPSGSNLTSAAKIVFWDRDSTNRFLNQYVWGTFRVGYYKPKVMLNRILVASQLPSTCSRVVRVVGPDAIVNEEYLRQYFERHFFYDLEEYFLYHHETDTSTSRVEFRFASYRAQAAAASVWLDRARTGNEDATAGMDEEEKRLWTQVRWFWGPDPCEGQ